MREKLGAWERKEREERKDAAIRSEMESRVMFEESIRQKFWHDKRNAQ